MWKVFPASMYFVYIQWSLHLIRGSKGQPALSKDFRPVLKLENCNKECMLLEFLCFLCTQCMEWTQYGESLWTVCWDIAACCLVEVDRRFKRAYCLHHQGGETHCPDNGGSTHISNGVLQQRRYMLEGCLLHTWRENPKSCNTGEVVCKHAICQKLPNWIRQNLILRGLCWKLQGGFNLIRISLNYFPILHLVAPFHLRDFIP
jgi:hypothetical protein